MIVKYNPISKFSWSDTCISNKGNISSCDTNAVIYHINILVKLSIKLWVLVCIIYNVNNFSVAFLLQVSFVKLLLTSFPQTHLKSSGISYSDM